jgi:carbamate kinase
MTDAPRAPRSVLLALGGNAIIPAKGPGTKEAQWAVVGETMRHVVDLLRAGWRVALTHGNGPIVGNILIRNEMARDIIAPMPLDMCGADSQGGIGYMMQQQLGNALLREGRSERVVTVVTQVRVDADDAAFAHPTKPIGPFYTRTQAELMQREKGWLMTSDADRGFRRVVASPEPREVIEREVIGELFQAGVIPIACGGGGIPVVRLPDGGLDGVEAVIDKDLAAAVLGNALGIETLVSITAVDEVSLDFGTPRARRLDRLSVEDAKRYLADGQFPTGSMGPKIDAAIRFLEGGGGAVIITSPERVLTALDGRAGTRVQM